MVSTQPSQAKLTYADYVALPDDGRRHEILGGAHYVTPSPVVRHQRIAVNLTVALRRHLDAHPGGEVLHAPCDVILSDTDIVVPDLIYVSGERSDIVTAKNLQGAPDLVIEILSPGTAARDRRLKRDLYERCGVREYWLVDPKADTVEVYRRHDEAFASPEAYRGNAAVTTPLLPGLELPLTSIFPASEQP